MVADYHGQVWNAAQFIELAVNKATVHRYLDLMAGVCSCSAAAAMV